MATRGTRNRSKANLNIVPTGARTQSVSAPIEDGESAIRSEGYTPVPVMGTPPPMRPSDMRLQTVQCPLNGYEHISVTYRTNNKRWIAEQFLQMAGMSDEDFISLLCQFIVSINGWNFLGVDGDGNEYLVPPPSKEHPKSFLFMWRELDDLSAWINKDGYKKAKEQALGN